MTPFRGLARDYARAHGSPAAANDPFAVQLADSPLLTSLYLDTEAADGYHRDQNVFGPGVTIEDDMAVLVRYASGATLTYHLTAYAPWEGYRISFNGSEGRLELLVEESTWARSDVRVQGDSAVLHGEAVGDSAGRTELMLRRFWEPPRELKVQAGEGGHGGGDVRMLADLFGEPAADPWDGQPTPPTERAPWSRAWPRTCPSNQEARYEPRTSSSCDPVADLTPGGHGRDVGTVCDLFPPGTGVPGRPWRMRRGRAARPRARLRRRQPARRLADASSGCHRLVNVGNGLCPDVLCGSTDYGAHVVQQSAGGGTSRQWQLAAL
ncbi:hypothetical protein [Streptomyces sp. NPDC127033]|uniref:hypothetical protein n=1 Tax=Streptomyces sp. NPDC127033 TaxID=3347110 RepID=UPI003658ACCA